MRNGLLEICTGDFESVQAAVAGGADRIELCAALSEGGITPSLGLMQTVRTAYPDLRIHVLIRPRGGDFVYTSSDVETMLADIANAKAAKADGIVVGALTADGDVDTAVMKPLIEAAQPLGITFHRAFDLCRNPEQSLETIITLGCHRLLTSGLSASAEEGIPQLKRLVAQADRRLIILPGGGVNACNAARILQETGVTELHASARSQLSSSMAFRRKEVSMGAAGQDEYSRLVTDEALVNALKNKLTRSFNS